MTYFTVEYCFLKEVILFTVHVAQVRESTVRFCLQCSIVLCELRD
jgi:hypothetical protein